MVSGISNWMNQAVWQARLQHLGEDIAGCECRLDCLQLCRNFRGELMWLPGQKAIADDILVFGSGETDEEAFEDHDGNLPCYH